MNIRLLAAGIMVLGVVLAGTKDAAAQEYGLELGSQPEPPVLETLDGEPVDMGDLIGETPVLIEFWATWCTVCRALEPSLAAAHERYGDQVEFVVVAAAMAQTKEDVRDHMEEHDLPLRVLWDLDGRATRAFDAPGTGYILILDESGTVVYNGVGASQDLVAAVGEALEK